LGGLPERGIVLGTLRKFARIKKELKRIRPMAALQGVIPGSVSKRKKMSGHMESRNSGRREPSHLKGGGECYRRIKDLHKLMSNRKNHSGGRDESPFRKGEAAQKFCYRSYRGQKQSAHQLNAEDQGENR